jgi:hypothetical protein
MNEHIRGVIWPRKSKDGTFGYAIVAMLVTDKEIPELAVKDARGISQVVVDSRTFGMADLLATLPHKKLEDWRILGDASDVLCSLGDWNTTPSD